MKGIGGSAKAAGGSSGWLPSFGSSTTAPAAGSGSSWLPSLSSSSSPKASAPKVPVGVYSRPMDHLSDWSQASGSSSSLGSFFGGGSSTSSSGLGSIFGGSTRESLCPLIGL